MKHTLTVTMNNGEVYEASDVDTRTLAGMLAMAESPTAQIGMMPLEWTTPPGAQRRLKYSQTHVRVGHVSSIQAQPAFWVGVRALFLEERSVWEIDADAMGYGAPILPTIVRLEEIVEDRATLTLVVPDTAGIGLAPSTTLPLDVFIEVTSPVSVDRLMDHGVVLSPWASIGRWPTDEEMRERLSS